MADNPLRIIITAPYPHPDEARRIARGLEIGFDFVHLRYPHLSAREVKSIIENVPQKYHGKLKLHDHFELLSELNLGGVHLNRRNPKAPVLAQQISRSCHSVEEVAAAAGSVRYAYVTLSPVFPSLSKQGYVPSLSDEDFAQAIDAAGSMPVIALGGVTPANAPGLSQRGFAGYAVLGYLADATCLADVDRRINEFLQLK